eukprot:CAMPEP_0170601576 /NCGR_PEP_ID=MMETSP0224-20130122/17935_1 /TAXON_ID=285029 /ORGANISM="Togula jolla, Strain CCCM 725" /LENGTH=97 /DNA_ID=CAMNT_0010926365 /DNA_START=33 /DNA_END=326 /DNA_ORIENTATION=+
MGRVIRNVHLWQQHWNRAAARPESRELQAALHPANRLLQELRFHRVGLLLALRREDASIEGAFEADVLPTMSFQATLGLLTWGHEPEIALLELLSGH